MLSKTFDIAHTRLKRSVTITKISRDQYNPMSIIVEFSYTRPTNYFENDAQIIFGLYVDRELIVEFHDPVVKFQLASVDAVSIVEVFAHPHGGFKFIRERLIPGNKIKIRFRAKDPTKRDVSKHTVFWDERTGTYKTKAMGEIEVTPTVTLSGRYLKSYEIV